MSLNSSVVKESLELALLSVFYLFNNSFNLFFFISTHLDPLVLHGLAETNFSNLSSYSSLDISLKSLFSKDKAVEVLLFCSTLGSIVGSLFTKFNSFSFDFRQADELFSF
jgi:hypothetical protein